MSHLVFPEHVTLKVQLWTSTAASPYRGKPLAFGVQTFARVKNDYQLGPFFSDEQGELRITRRQLELAAAAELSSGIMDYDAIGNAFALVEIAHWSGRDVEGAIDARTKSWRHLLEGEEILYGSVEALVARLRTVGNASLLPAADRYGRLRDEWDGTLPLRSYDYPVSSAPSA